MIDRKKALLFVVLLFFFFTLIFSFVLVILLAVVVSLRVFHENSKENIEKDESFDYRYVQYDPSSTKSTVGILSLMTELEKDEYISYQNDDQHVLISNFGTEQYKCTGRCSCEMKSDQRRATSTISTGIMGLFIAATALFAHQIAKNSFNEKCERELEDECPPNSAVYSEVEDCEVFGKEIEEKDLQEGNYDSKNIVYKCQGKCMEADVEYLDEMFEDPIFDKSPKEYILETWDKIKARDCSKLTIATDIAMEVSDTLKFFESSKQLQKSLGLNVPVLDSIRSWVEYQFAVNQLNSFCHKMTEIVKGEGYTACHAFNMFSKVQNEILPPFTMEELNPTLSCVEKAPGDPPSEDVL